MLEEVDLDKVRDKISDIIESLSKEGVDINNIKVFKYSIIPMRIQHIVHELSKKGLILKSTVIVDGDLLLIALKTSNKDLNLAPDYEKFSG